MKTNILRLAKSLEKIDFYPVRQEANGNIQFSKNESNGGLFDWLSITFAGQNLQHVLAWAAISVIGKGALLKGLAENEVMCEIATNESRCTTLIESDNQSLAWERRLIENLPKSLDSLRVRFGGALLERTLVARQKMAEYTKKLPSNIVAWYQSLPDTENKKKAQEISRGPICHLNDFRMLYEIAVFILLSHGNEVEGDIFNFDGFRPFELMDKNIMWRVDLLVDWMLNKK